MPRSRSFFLMYEFQKFLTSLSVLPGSCAAICDHLVHAQPCPSASRPVAAGAVQQRADGLN
uniref:Uncharacterized protein n=1 Tax=Oryza brachyantha TaxID=4533 RepID=J3LP54_ORYBR